MLKKFIRFNTFSVGSFLLGALFTVAVTNVDAALKGSAIFRDVPAGHFADQAIGDAYNAQILTGYDSTHFGPNDPVTRGQLAVILSRLHLVSTTNTNTNTASSTRTSSSQPASSSSSSSAMSSSSSSAEATPAGQLRFDFSSYSQDESASSKVATIVVVRTGGNQGTVTVDYAFGSGTAVIGTDYTPVSGTLTFANKETSKKITIAIMDDTVQDGNKTVFLKLSNATNGAILSTPNTATLNLIDNETVQTSSSTGTGSSASSVASTNISFSAATYGVMENGGSLTVTVVRSGVTSGTNAVNYSTSNSNGVAGTDYTAAAGTFTFAPGETTKTFTVSVNDNTTPDGNRAFNVNLTTATNGANIPASGGSALATIIDNESAPTGSGSFKFSSATYNVIESAGNAAITIMRTIGVTPVSVTFSTSGGTASSGSDYTSVSATVSFAQGETSKIFLVPIVKDSTSEVSETLNLSLSNPTNGLSLMDPTSAVLTIND